MRLGGEIEGRSPHAVLVDGDAVAFEEPGGVALRDLSNARAPPRAPHSWRGRGRRIAADAAERDALVGQPFVGVVGAQRQPVFGARGEHAIGFADALGGEIVDHHAEIGFGAVENRAPSCAAGAARRVEASDQPLRGRFLVAGGAVDLAGEKKPGRCAALPAPASSSAGIDIVIFDRVARSQDARPLQPGDGRDQRRLRLLGQRGRDAVGIDGADRRRPPARGRSGGFRGRRSGSPCPRSTGNSAARVRRSRRNRRPERWALARTIACVSAVVRVMWQGNCGAASAR